MIDASEQTIDIVDKPDTKVEDLDLSKIEPVAQTLKLSVEQTYVVGLWFKYAKLATF